MTDGTETADSGNEQAETADIETSSDNLANELFPDKPALEEAEEEQEAPELESPEVAEEKTEVTAKSAPKSWKKEMHESFAKLDPATKEYIELREKQMVDGLEKDRNDALLGRTMRDTIQPYQAVLQAQGVTEQQAVQHLLRSHYRLTNGTNEERLSAYQELGRNLGFNAGEQEQVDPAVKALRDELSVIKNTISQGQNASLQEARSKVTKDVESFASDPSHPYFDDVADDIIIMLKSGIDLKDAYDKAVWANPITRQKEIARLKTEQEGEIRKKAIDEATAKKKLTAVNINSRDTKKAPTGPKATMKNLDGALRETMQEIKSRNH